MDKSSPRHYELVLMIDPELSDGDREGIADTVRKQIEAGGELELADSWGTRKMAFEIKQRNEADYRLFRFVGSKQLLDDLDHSLKIVDGALRFRVFKVDPEAPTAAPPAVTAMAAAGSSDRRDDRGDRGDRGDRDDRGRGAE